MSKSSASVLVICLALLMCMVLPIYGENAVEGKSIGEDLSLWSVIPFILTLLSIALLPLLVHHWWEKHLNKGIIVLIFGLPVVIYIGMIDYHELLHQGFDYVSFIILLASLYIISGGIHLKGSLAGTPLVNTILLAIGAVLASFIGTTGASMVLIRPLLRANRIRKRKIHIIIFFIFLVSNIGGCLTPLGDPPLFLGFLKGVPFLWTFSLWKQWAFVCGILLILFNLIDQWIFNKEDIATPGALIVPNEPARGESLRDPEAVSSGASPFGKDVEPKQPLSIEGKRNFIFLFGIMVTVFCSGQFHWSTGIREAIMVLITVFSFVCTPDRFRKSNAFTFNPIIEVAIIFAGIFASMIPALLILNARGTELGLTLPWHFFWVTGGLSSFLDNAPTYLTLTATASSVVGTPMTLLYVKELLSSEMGETLLTAISLGAVFMGANTYIGNAPNFMVKAIAEESGIKMPSFFGYMLYPLIILIPIFVLVTIVFLI